MASYTYSLHGLCTTFNFLFDHFDAMPETCGGNPKLSKFLLKYAATLSKKDKLANLQCWARTCGDQAVAKKIELMERWIANDERQNSTRITSGRNLLFATVYTFDQKWVTKMGRQQDIKGYASFGVKGYYDEQTETASALTESGARLFFWFSDKKDGLSLYVEACKEVKSNALHEKDEIVLPFLNLMDLGSYGLDDWQLTMDTSVVSCQFENKLILNDKGAKAKSVTRTLAKSRSLPYQPKRIIFNKPFAVAILEKGCKYPSLVAYCDRDSWQKTQ